MNTHLLRAAALLFLLETVAPSKGQGDFSAALPADVKVVWNLNNAHRESTPTSDRICLNGLWRWQPARDSSEAVPRGGWGFYKVPGAWPGITDYMQKDCQTVFPHEAWRNERFENVSAAWHEREIEIPADWAGRRIIVSTEYLNSFAVVYVDGKKAGEMRFPAGEIELTPHCRPGGKHILSILVQAMPLKGVLLSYSDSASAREVKGSVARRGLCGDVYLEGIRNAPRLGEIKVRTSVRASEISFLANLSGLKPKLTYRLRATVTSSGEPSATFESGAFEIAALQNGVFEFTQKWRPKNLWDIHTPQNQVQAILTLLDAEGASVDESFPISFGYRELWIEGRDFFLNGKRLFLSSVPLDNAQVGAAWAEYGAARESLERLKSFGINFVYTHNYGCEPGSHLSFEAILKAADDAGMLVALSQPHFSHYDWKAPNAEAANSYSDHARFYAKVAGNHPSVVFYSMSHNATGYSEDMNPAMIDGVRDGRDQWASNNAKLALRAEKIVAEADPSRIVYHHASGNLGSMHPINFYPNFVPPQELSDWFEHWAKNGVKPVFLCEYGAPFTWDWTMYRGWHKGQREFGSAKVPWEFCLAEWNAQFFGDGAYRISEAEKANLRWEAKQFRAGNLWHRWDYPHAVGSSIFDERYPVFALYLKDNWRAFRGWGVSAISPWEYEHFWKLREGVSKKRLELKVDWENLQRPGYSADYIGQRYERMDLAFERDDWIPTAAAKTLMDHNGPLLGFIGGKEAAFTSKDHIFHAGETLEKQLIVINNSRETVRCKLEWTFEPAKIASGNHEATLPTGEQVRIPVRLQLPPTLPPGDYQLKARFEFESGLLQQDTVTIHVVPVAHSTQRQMRIALFDPVGESKRVLEEQGIMFQTVNADSKLADADLLIVGKGALTVTGAAPDISRVRDGLKVILFEQTAEVLEKRFGFRVAEYGLRQAFPRIPDHPVLTNIKTELLRDWRGEATLLPPRLQYELRPRHGPTVKWAGLPVPRLWRCGNRGNVASVLIEKPARGDFLPIIDGGYALQYSPLLEFRDGKGMMLFCQMDVTGRTEKEPAAATLLRNIFEHAANWKPAPSRAMAYAGDPAGAKFFESLGAKLDLIEGELSTNTILAIGPGGARSVIGRKEEIAKWLGAGGRLLAIGLDQEEANLFFPKAIRTRQAEHISAHFEPPSSASIFAGIAPADLHNRDPHPIPFVDQGADTVGGGILALSENAVFCQIVPWRYADLEKMNLKRTFRRASFAVSRLLGNLGAARSSPVIERFNSAAMENETRWLDGLYLDQPEEWDDPYRFFRW